MMDMSILTKKQVWRHKPMADRRPRLGRLGDKKLPTVWITCRRSINGIDKRSKASIFATSWPARMPRQS